MLSVFYAGVVAPLGWLSRHMEIFMPSFVFLSLPSSTFEAEQHLGGASVRLRFQF
jgi:hypothetical protein